MADPLSLETLLGEFDGAYKAWILKDAKSGLYVTIPHPRYPGRIIFHFFMSRGDAEDVLEQILDEGNEKLSRAVIVPTEVNLHDAMRSIAKSGSANGFVVHPPNEIFEFLNSRRS